MKKILTILVFTLLLPFRAEAEALVGDVNGDGRLSISDVNRLIWCLQRPARYYAGLTYIDLGLPSGLLWATSNIGTTTSIAPGYYYAWAEIKRKDVYNWTTYKWGTSSTTMTKYCTSSSYGTVDGQSTLLPEDDIAHVSTGSAWHVPSFDDWDELKENCIIWADSIYSSHGWSVMSRSNYKTMFLFNAGYRADSLIYNEDYDAFYWANATYAYNSSVAYGFYLGPSYKGWGYRSRGQGYPVRPVIYSYETVCDVNKDGDVDVADVYALAQILLEL